MLEQKGRLPATSAYSLLPTGEEQAELAEAVTLEEQPPGGNRQRTIDANEDPLTRMEVQAYDLDEDDDEDQHDFELKRALNGQRGEIMKMASVFLMCKPFQMLIAGCIVANGLCIGFETDHPEFTQATIIENGFLAIFLVEMVLRIICFTPMNYFWDAGSDLRWNLFDCFLVTVGVVDVASSLAAAPGKKHKSSAAMAFRLIRLFRIVRIFRIVKYLQQLYVLAHGIFVSLLSLFWVTILMIFGLYVCSVVLVRCVGTMDFESKPELMFLKIGFPSVFKGMFTLFELMVNPALDDYYAVFSDPSQCMLTLFVLAYVIFGSFGMIAVLTGVMQEGMFQKNLVRQAMERAEAESTRDRLVSSCTLMYEKLPKTEDGEVKTADVFKLLPKISSLFESIGVHIQDKDLEDCIHIMDTDFSGSISEEEFTHFLLQISENVRPILVLDIRRSVNEFALNQHQQTRAMIKDMLSGLGEVKELLGAAPRAAESSDGPAEAAAAAVSGSMAEDLATRRLLIDSVADLKACILEQQGQQETPKSLLAGIEELKTCMRQGQEQQDIGSFLSNGIEELRSELQNLVVDGIKELKGCARDGRRPLEANACDGSEKADLEMLLSKGMDDMKACINEGLGRCAAQVAAKPLGQTAPLISLEPGDGWPPAGAPAPSERSGRSCWGWPLGEPYQPSSLGWHHSDGADLRIESSSSLRASSPSAALRTGSSTVPLPTSPYTAPRAYTMPPLSSLDELMRHLRDNPDPAPSAAATRPSTPPDVYGPFATAPLPARSSSPLVPLGMGEGRRVPYQMAATLPFSVIVDVGGSVGTTQRASP